MFAVKLLITNFCLLLNFNCTVVCIDFSQVFFNGSHVVYNAISHSVDWTFILAY